MSAYSIYTSIRPAAVREALHTMGSRCAEVAQLKDVAATVRLAGGEKLNALHIIIILHTHENMYVYYI